MSLFNVPTLHLPFARRCGACGRALKFEDSVIAGEFITAFAPDGTKQMDGTYCPGDADSCHFCANAPEATACHPDCFFRFCTEIKGQDRSRKLSIASTWRDPCYHCPTLLLPPADNNVDAVEDVCRIPSLTYLPDSVQHMGLKIRGDPAVWRYHSVSELALELNCAPSFAGKLALDQIHRWSRGQVPTLSQTLSDGQPSAAHTSRPELPVAKASKKPYILFIIDSQGIRHILRVAELVDRPDHRSEKLRYISGPAESFSGFSVQFMFGLARLIVPPGRKVQIWRSEVPPKLPMMINAVEPSPDLASNMGYFRASCFKSIDLERCDGLTVFSTPHGVLAIHGHTPEDPFPLKTLEDLHPLQLRHSATWFFVPLVENDELLSLGLRFQNNQGRLTLPSFIIRLESGKYTIGPWYKAEDGPAEEYTFQIVGKPTLVYEISKFSIPSLTVLPQTPIYKKVKTLDATLPQLMHGHFSWAPLEDIYRVMVFFDRYSGFCKGMIITYDDLTNRVLGECRWGPQPVIIYENPSRLFYFQGEHRRYNASWYVPSLKVSDVRFAGDGYRAPPACYHGMGWRSCELSGRLHFWYNSRESHISVHQA
ncbi:unnamed protein product [Clonostachys rosea]|uniref:Heterokaryon incompatibility domain-containing protein n=1 Tax=Bionectria ochroleuca TaxID=29856 RepID=A0ABY6UP24_BIOOC|nr:unnamed protein product [Clonostachys rosea]